MLLILFAASLLASEVPSQSPDAVRLMPGSDAVKGWAVYPDTLVYASGGDLTEIYNGDFERYTKNGVLDAAQQMYQQKDDIATLTIHRMTSRAAAKKFYQEWKKSDARQPTYKVLKIAAEGYVYTADGVWNGCLYTDKYYVTISTYVDGEAGRTASEGFLKNASAGIVKLTKPKPKEDNTAK